MIPQYEYVVTGFIFGLVVALDIMCIANIVSAIIKRKKQENLRNLEKLKELARQVNYEDLPRKYRKVLKDEHTNKRAEG